MTVAEFKRRQKEKLAEQKAKPLQKISNNFINNTIASSNQKAIKTIYYLATIIEKFEQLEQQQDKRLLDITIDTREMLKYTEMSLPNIRRNLKSMQETSISFINEKEGIEEGINLLPLYKFVYGKHQIKISLFVQIAKMIVDVKKNYTFLNTKELMSLKNKHSLRLLPLLNTIAGYDKEVGKRKRMTLEELNEFFGTKHRSLYDLKKKILMPVKEELDNKSKLSFIYDINFESLGKGRPRAKDIVIDVIERNVNVQKQQKQQTFKETKLDENLSKYIDKKFYKEGYTWMILAISQIDKNNFQVFVRDVDDKTYTKTFEISKAQLQAAK